MQVFKGQCRGVQEVALKFFHPNMAREMKAIVDHEVGQRVHGLFGSNFSQGLF